MPSVVDSSGWIEYYIDGSNAGHFAKAIEDPANLVVPAVSITEVFRWNSTRVVGGGRLGCRCADEAGKSYFIGRGSGNSGG